jgi:hypothetical protein
MHYRQKNLMIGTTTYCKSDYYISFDIRDLVIWQEKEGKEGMNKQESERCLFYCF